MFINVALRNEDGDIMQIQNFLGKNFKMVLLHCHLLIAKPIKMCCECYFLNNGFHFKVEKGEWFKDIEL